MWDSTISCQTENTGVNNSSITVKNLFVFCGVINAWLWTSKQTCARSVATVFTVTAKSKKFCAGTGKTILLLHRIAAAFNVLLFAKKHQTDIQILLDSIQTTFLLRIAL
jgi:hypothetical protein